MTKFNSLTVLLIASVSLMVGVPSSAFAACTNTTPCTWMLYAKPSTSNHHLTYGDKLKLKFTGNKTELIPYADDWESGAINLKPTIIFDPAGDPLDPQKGWIIPGWEFKFKNKDTSHLPPDNDHLKVHLYKHPANNEWVITGAEHSDGTVHGGTAHMTD